MHKTLEELQSILETNGLNLRYDFNENEHVNQSIIESEITILEAFKKGIDALFVINKENENLDNLVFGILENPKDFGLENNPTQEAIKKTICTGLNEQSECKITLLPLVTEEESDIYPPENSENVKENWIWYVNTGDFYPGPVWIVVNRYGKKEAYHYGYY